MPSAKGHDYDGSGMYGDPLVPLQHWPRVALARSIIAALEARSIRLDGGQRIAMALINDLPPEHIAALALAGMISG